MSTPSKRVLSAANQAKLVELHEKLGRCLDEVLADGWHGQAGVQFVVVDGTIQQVFRVIEEKGPAG